MGKASVTIAISGEYNSKAAERAERSMERLATKVAALDAGAGSSIVNAGSKVAEFGGKLYSAGDKAEQLGNRLTTGLTLPLAALGVATGKAAVTIDTSLTNVRKTVDATDEEYEQLKDSAIEFSKTNAVSASQILDIEALGAQLGYSKDELEDFGEVVSGLDIATNMDAETAGTNLAQFANITRMAHDESENYASAIVALGNTSATTESDISDMSMRIAASGTQVGMTQADILGLSAALSSMGVDAEAGGTAISTIMAQIDKDVATNSDSLQTWADTAGMSAEQFSAAWSSDPTAALASVLSGLQDATDAGGNMSVMLDDLGISSLRQTDVMKRLAGNSDLVTTSVNTANQAWQDNTALDDEVANRNDSLAAKFEMLQNKVTAVAEEVGKPLCDAALDAVDAAEPLLSTIEGAANAFSAMDKGTQQTIIKWVALAAAAGPVLSVTGKLTKGVGNVVVMVGKGMQAFGTYKDAMTTTSTKTVDTYQKTGTLATKLGLAQNKYVQAAGGAKQYSATVNAGAKAAGEAAAKEAVEAAQTAGVTEKKELAKVATDAATKAEDKYRASVTTASVATETQAGKLDKFASKAEGVAASVGKMAGIAGAAVGVASMAQEVWKLATNYDQLEKEMSEASEDMGSFSEAVSSATPASVDLDLAMSNSGKSISSLQQTASDCMGNITSIISDNVEQWGGITEQGAADIEANLSTALQASNDAAEGYANSISAVVSSYSSQVGTLDEAGLAQYVSDVNNAFSQGKDAAKDSLDQQLQAIQSYHQQAGDIGSDAYAQDVANAQAAYDQQLQTIEDAKDDAISKTSEMGQGITDEQAQAWDTANTQMDDWKSGFKKFWADGNWYDSSTLTTQAEEEFDGLVSAAEDGTTAAWVAASVATVDGGGQLDDATKKNLSNMIGTFDNLPGSLQDKGTEAMRSLANSIEASGVELGDVSSMSGQQIVDKLKEKLDLASAQGTTSGQALDDNLASGIIGNVQGIIDASGVAAAAQSNADASGSSWTWGYDMADNLAAGINAGRTAVRVAAEAVASVVSANLHQSVADVGPLKYTDQWGGDLVDNIATGMDSGIPRLAAASGRVANAITTMVNGSPTISASAAASTGFGGGKTTVYNVSLDGVTINDSDAIRSDVVQLLSDVTRRSQMLAGRA